MAHNFSQLTTLHLGGEMRDYTAIISAEHLKEYYRSNPQGVFVLGGGSNIVVTDDPIDFPVVHMVNSGRQVCSDDTGRPYVMVDAGVAWDEIVAESIERGWGGLECLSGIPGTVGGAVVQNIGAYGVEISQLLRGVLVFDKENISLSWWGVAEMEYRYRYSKIKHSDRFIVVQAQLWLTPGSKSMPIVFDSLAQIMGVVPGTQAPASAVRDAVLAIRSSKGMVVADNDYDTWSVGSFFVNPVVEIDTYERLCAQFPVPIPSYPGAHGSEVKIPAAWLIEQAGFPKGFSLPGSHVGLSTKHTLALTNRGHGSTAELLELARYIRARILHNYGIELCAEPIFVGCHL